MLKSAICLFLSLGAGLLHAQMTIDQKLADFQHLASIYAKNYGPYEWKIASEKFDLLDLRPWLGRVRETKDDLDFYELCVEYVSSLNDAHDVFTLPSIFSASLGFTVDVYDGIVLIDSITRARLPVRDYPFQIGDELVSVDGSPVEELIQKFWKYGIAANRISTRRNAAGRIPSRPQALMPHAHEIGDNATVVVRRLSGDLETYDIAWLKTGVPITAAGPVLSPRTSSRSAPLAYPGAQSTADPAPDYMQALLKLQNVLLPDERQTVLGFGSRTPLFALPAGFTQRLGMQASDVFYSGIFEAGGYKIGYIRIPNYSQPSAGFAVNQFENEIVEMNAKTDGLIVDDMHNPGGNACYVESLLTRLIPYRFRTLGFELRATSNWVASLSSSLEFAKRAGAEQWIIDLYTAILADVREANSENRGRTGALPLCGPTLELEPARDKNGAVIAYSKPIMLLVDEFSASGGDMFPAVFQDNGRGPLFGIRTMGAGGNVVSSDATIYSEGSTRVTESLMNRKNPVVTGDYPTAPYVENIGVRPEIEADYMTRENLLTRGAPFVRAFTSAIVELVRTSKNQ